MYQDAYGKYKFQILADKNPILKQIDDKAKEYKTYNPCFFRETKGTNYYYVQFDSSEFLWKKKQLYNLVFYINKSRPKLKINTDSNNNNNNNNSNNDSKINKLNIISEKKKNEMEEYEYVKPEVYINLHIYNMKRIYQKIPMITLLEDL